MFKSHLVLPVFCTHKNANLILCYLVWSEEHINYSQSMTLGSQFSYRQMKWFMTEPQDKPWFLRVIGLSVGIQLKDSQQFPRGKPYRR